MTTLPSCWIPRVRTLTTPRSGFDRDRSEEHTSELQSPYDLVCRLLLEKKKINSGEGIMSHVGVNRGEIAAANDCVCGTLTVEGPHYLKDGHPRVSDCANRCGRNRTRCL